MATYTVETSFLISNQKHENDLDKTHNMNSLLCFMMKSVDNMSLDPDSTVSHDVQDT